MDDIFPTIRHTQKRQSENCSDVDEEYHDLIDHILLPNWVQDLNQPGISSDFAPGQISNVSTPQTFQSPNFSNGSVLKRNVSNLSGPERAMRKRRIDQAYRERCRNLKTEMQSNMENLKGENDSLKIENESLKEANSLMNQTLRDQEYEIEKLRSDFVQIKREYEQQNVLVQTLSGLLADPMRLENEKLKDENASLRKNADLNSNLPQLAEDNAKLRIENKVLKVQNDALCGKIISDNDMKREQDQ
ncbi:uncharacterized protein LOC120135482 [Hibiscus syriacus]|uniref:uncharacterized protein LOC120135482 n=1 Tax=Hibiscus syriacus TaxID=106335 RepID=UPI001921E8D6|nr:uncharacterized protein LOC120135482 [Hibiscus syriacus]